MAADAPSFVHLRLHTAYSLSEGAIRIPDLLSTCRSHGMPAAAITDTDNMFGALEFAFSAKKQGIQPIVGCQLGLARKESGNGSTQRSRQPAAPPAPLVFLAQSETGYHNLMRLLSRCYLATEAGERPKASLSMLAELGEGVLCLTGGPDGPVGQLIREGRQKQADQLTGRLAEIFPGRLYMEIQRHGLASEAATEAGFLEIAYARDIPLLATNEAFFTEASMHGAHDALLCIAEGAYISQDDRRTVTPEHYLKTPAEMAERFADLPEAVQNTVVAARRCGFMPEPIDPILPPYDSASGRSEADELYHQAVAGLETRLATHVFTEDMDEADRAAAAQPYWQRLEHEWSIITRMGFPGYFLIVADFIQYAKTNGIPVGPGRGSGAGSVIAWALTITDLDPLRFNLLFERFLNPERVSMPDFDIDFCQERRDQVLDYVQRKYGHEKVAQIITFGKLQARAVLRDVGRVLQMPFGQVDKICKLVPNNPANPVTLDEAIEQEPQLQQWISDDETVARLVETARPLEGLYRHASTHAAGVVIGDRALEELVPLYRDPRADMPVTQFNMKYVEQAGLVKFDFLGLKTLTVLKTAQELVRAGGGTPPDLATVRLDDPQTFGMLQRGETVGVFQLESSGMRDVLRKLRPDRFEDIIAVVALYRPGPMDNIPRFIACKHGEEEVDYLHPKLEPILRETFGVMIYQEQVMQAAQELAGYSLGAADLLRRAMGKKIQSEMDRQRDIFIEGAVERGVERDTADRIFDQVAKFAGYGFNKSHAASYALVAYHTAYMKANHPVAFLAASMTLDITNTDKLNVFYQELDRLGHPVLPPDINAADVHFRTEFVQASDGSRVEGVRYALAALKGVGEGAVQAIVATRHQGGPYRSLVDFAERVPVQALNRKLLEHLALAGAFDSITSNRRQVYDSIDALLRHAHACADEAASGQVSLFGGAAGAGPPAPELADVADWPNMERLRYEFETIGFYLSAHPLDDYARAFQRLGIVRHADVEAELARGSSTRLQMAGLVAQVQTRRARSGNRIGFIQLSDPSGVYEVMAFSEVLQATRHLLEPGTPVVVTADAQGNGPDERRFVAQTVEPLESYIQQASHGVRLVIADSSHIAGIRSVLDQQSRGRQRVRLVVPLAKAGGTAEVELPEGYMLGERARQQLKAVPGVGAVRDL